MEISLQSQLSRIFEAYCGQQSSTLDGKSFAKFAKDSHLIDKSLTQADVDLIFAKVKVNKTERRISFDEFINSLELMSTKKGINYKQLACYIAETNHGPILTATKVDQVILHDDRSTYTGVYAKGGPSTVDPQVSMKFSMLGFEEIK